MREFFAPGKRTSRGRKADAGFSPDALRCVLRGPRSLPVPEHMFGPSRLSGGRRASCDVSVEATRLRPSRKPQRALSARWRILAAICKYRCSPAAQMHSTRGGTSDSMQVLLVSLTQLFRRNRPIYGHWSVIRGSSAPKGRPPSRAHFGHSRAY